MSLLGLPLTAYTTGIFFSQLWSWKSKIKVLANSVPSESSLPGLQKVTFSLCRPHMADRHSLLTSAPKTHHHDPSLRNSSKPSHPSKPRYHHVIG